MIKNKVWLGIILSIFLLVFSINGFTTDYKYTQESGTGFFVGTPDKADAQEDTNEIRQIINDLGALLEHSKMDGTYPKDLTTGGTIQIPEAGLKFSNAPANNDIAAYIAGEMTWQTKAELGIDLTLYYLKTQIDTLSEVETIYTKDITDSTELAAALGAYYLKTAIDTQGEVETIWGVSLLNDITGEDFADLADIPVHPAVATKILETTIDSYAWIDTPSGGGASQLSDLSDVGVTTPTDKYVLVADGDSWESRAISSNDLSDVTSIAMLDENEAVTGTWDFTDSLTITHISDNPYPVLQLRAKRDGDPTANVADGDCLGYFYFQGFHTGYYHDGAYLLAFVDGTPGAYDMPTRLEFYTTPDGDDTPDLRLAIDNAGNIKMGDGAWTNYVNVTAGGAMTAEGTASIKATDLVITNQAAGDILYFNGTNWIRLAKGTAGQILTMNAGGTAPEWQTP